MGNCENVKYKYKPWFIVYSLYVFLLPIDSLTIIPGVRILTILALVASVWAFLCVSLSKLSISNDVFIVILYLLLQIVSVVNTINYKTSMFWIPTMLLNIGLVLFFTMIPCTIKDVDLLKMALLLGSWLTVVLMLVTRRSGGVDATERLGVVIGNSDADPNYLCMHMYYGVAYYVDALYKEDNKAWAVVSLFFFAVMVLLSGSRGGLLGYLAVVATIVFMHIIKSQRRKKAKTIFVALLLFALAIVLVPYLFELLPSSVAVRFSVEQVLRDRGSERVDIWIRILKNFSEGSVFNKLFGYGMGTAELLSETGSVAHNQLVEVLVNVGLVGVVVYIYLMYRMARICWIRNKYVVLGYFMGLMMLSMSLSTTFVKPYWNIILLILMLKKTSSEFGAPECVPLLCE